MERKAKEEVSKKRKREEEKEKNETEVKRRCVNLVSAEACDIFSQESFRIVIGILCVIFWIFFCGWSDCGSVSVSDVLVVTDVCACSFLTWNLVNRSPFLSPRSVLSLVWRARKTGITMERQ